MFEGNSLQQQGKVREAIKTLSDNDHHKVLQTNEIVHPSGLTVLDILSQKHPQCQPATREALIGIGHAPPSVHPVVFERIDGDSIRKAALSTLGAGAWSFGYRCLLLATIMY